MNPLLDACSSAITYSSSAEIMIFFHHIFHPTEISDKRSRLPAASWEKKNNARLKSSKGMFGFYSALYLKIFCISLVCSGTLKNPTELLMKVSGGCLGEGEGDGSKYKWIKRTKTIIKKIKIKLSQAADTCVLLFRQTSVIDAPALQRVISPRPGSSQAWVPALLLKPSAFSVAATAAVALRKTLQWMDSQWRVYWIKSL